jgi:putative SOS response-associated peptidase YedK
MASLHNRMPVILPRRAYAQWLDPEPQGADTLQPLLAPFAAELMIAHPVSTLVNSPANDLPEAIRPLAA